MSHELEKRFEARQGKICTGSALAYVTKRLAVITPPRTLNVARLLLLPLLLALPSLSAQSDDIRHVTQSEYQASLGDLSLLRSLIESEQVPLSKELGRLEAIAEEKRIEADRVKRLRDNQVVDLASAQNRNEGLKQGNRALSQRLGDYLRSFESHLHVGEKQLYQEMLNAAKAAGDNILLPEIEIFQIQFDAIDAAFGRIGLSLGGYSFEGGAIMQEGAYGVGNFIVVGPISYFVDKKGKAGMAALDVSSEIAIIQDVENRFAKGINQLHIEKSASVPIDATLGDAAKIAAARDNIIGEIKKGKAVMYPLLGLAIVALLIAIFKWFEINSVKAARDHDLHLILEHIRAGKPEAALAHAKSVEGPVGHMLLAAVENIDADPKVIEELLHEKILVTQPRLERMLPFIAVTAATAPLFGLLGTVTGMITTFNLITEFGTGDASNLSSGISEALITTKYGLIIAIPSLICFALLSRKAKGVIASMEKSAVGFLNGLEKWAIESGRTQ